MSTSIQTDKNGTEDKYCQAAQNDHNELFDIINGFSQEEIIQIKDMIQNKHIIMENYEAFKHKKSDTKLKKPKLRNT